MATVTAWSVAAGLLTPASQVVGTGDAIPQPLSVLLEFLSRPPSYSPLPGKPFLTSKPTSYKGPLRTTAKSPSLYFIRYGDISQSSVKKALFGMFFYFYLVFFVRELASSLLFLLILHSKGSTFCDLFRFAVFLLSLLIFDCGNNHN